MSAIGATARAGRALLVTALALGLATCRYPQDVEKTLERVQGGVLAVGAIENPPWVVRAGDGAAGVEAELVTGLAAELGADVHWHWGTASELLPALRKFQLDLVVGGLVEAPGVGHGVALTNPYLERRAIVGLEGEPEPRKHVWALPPGENAWMLTVQHYLDDARGLERRLQELERRQ